jgi:undecaprenyl pyrophosphate phosphatase UppP
MQLAALAAVISHFWRHVSDLLFGSLSAIGRRDFSDRSLKLAFGIAIGTLPIGVAALALAKLLNTCTCYLSREFRMTVRPNHLGMALQPHRAKIR